MEATNVQSSKSTNEVPNLEEAHDENREGGSKVEKNKGKRKAADQSTSKNPEAGDEGGRVLNCYRSSFTPKTVEALICTQNWCRSSPISTDVEELVEDLEKLELDLAPIPQLNEEQSDAESD